MTLDKASTLRLLCHSTLDSNLEDEVANFLLVYQNKKTTTNQTNTPSASTMTPNNDINQLTHISEIPAPNPFTHSHSTPFSPYLASAIQSSQVQPNSLPTMVHYSLKRNHQLRVQISHKMTNTPTLHIQAWIYTLCQDTVANTLVTIE